MATHTCDGCGRTVNEAHVRERILRLEAATRFRPLHIATLLVACAPPAKLADDFYWLEASEASAGGQFFQRQLLESVGLAPGEQEDRAKQLSEFQRAGIYLAYLSECPLPDEMPAPQGFPGHQLASLTRALSTRIRFSYKPKRVILLGQEMSGVVGRLRDAGLASVLGDGNHALLPLPAQCDAAATAAFRRAMAEVLKGSSLQSATG